MYFTNPGTVPRAGEDRAQKVSKQTSWLLDRGENAGNIVSILPYLLPNVLLIKLPMQSHTHTLVFFQAMAPVGGFMSTQGYSWALLKNRSAALNIQILRKHLTYN